MHQIKQAFLKDLSQGERTRRNSWLKIRGYPAGLYPVGDRKKYAGYQLVG